MTTPRTLFDKIWEAHVVERLPDGTVLLYIDRHLIHEVTTPQAFEGLRAAGRKVRRPDATLAVVDHNVPTDSTRFTGIEEPESALQIATLERNVRDFGVPYIPLNDPRQGIVHVIGPELGLSQPGMTIVCGDSHTSTHGALGALAFGIGTSEVEHVLATQTPAAEAGEERAHHGGRHARAPACTAKDIVLAIIGKIGTAGGTGHVIEYAGEAIRALDMAGRMTVCNMSIEAGARAGMIAPDETTFAYLKGRPFAPKGEAWEKALAYWRTLPSDPGARFDREVWLNAADIAPMVTWGTNPEACGCRSPAACPIRQRSQILPSARRCSVCWTTWASSPGQPLAGHADRCGVHRVLHQLAHRGHPRCCCHARGRKVAEGVRALVVPGSGLVKKQAEEEGLDRILKEAGFEWREAGCSMCLGMNPDKLKPGQRCASTSNRNFEGRQGPGGRTHLLSPAMAAAAAIAGRLVDVREMAR